MAYKKYWYKSARARNKRKYSTYKNWDTWSTVAVIGNDEKCYDYVRGNKDKLLKMKKYDKLKAIESHSQYSKFGGVSYRNVDNKALNKCIRYIDED